MNLLLDTHTLLWFLRDDPQLSSHAKSEIENAANRKVVSIGSCWEIAIKAGIGKLKLGESTSSLLSRELARNNFELLPITLEHATAVETLPMHHRDPFDRILVVQAFMEHMSIISSDPVFDSYPVARLW